MEYEAACYNLYDKKSYNKLEEVLKYISTNFVTVDDGSKMAVNTILPRVLDTIIPAMKSVSSLFNVIFETLYYGGSFYDGVKIGQPNEFDIDLLLHLPKILNAQVIPSTQPGFVFVQLQDWDRFKKDKNLYSLYKDLESMKDSYNYLVQEKVLRWIQQTVAKALNKIYKEGLLPGITISYRMSGPAVTLQIVCHRLEIDVDIVAVFRMPEKKWPGLPFRPCPSKYYNPSNNFFVVPKPPKSDEIVRPRCWRLSFQIYEQHIMNRHNFYKPALRLLKKLRDTRKHNIPSYFIKTIFLWRAEMEMQDARFWNNSLNFVFMEMLQFYKLALDSESIRYYWNPDNNLLQNTKPETIANIRNFLERMINTIHKNIDNDPYILAKFLLPEHEYVQLVHHFNGTEYECARNEPKLYANFKADDSQADSGSTFLRILACAAVGAAVFFFRR